MTVLDIVVIVAYFLGLVGVGFYASGKIASLTDYVVAGRTLTAPILVGSFVATYYGLDVTFGNPETSFVEGMSTFYFYSAPFYIAYALLALYIAGRVRESAALTLPDYFVQKFGRSMMNPASLVIVFYCLPILSIFGFGVLGEYFFGLSPFTSMLIGGAFAAGYTMLGGMVAEAMSDLLQFVLMCFGVGVIALFAMLDVGSLGAFGDSLPDPMVAPMGTLDWSDIVVYFAIALTPLVDPGLYQRILAARDVSDVRRGLLFATVIWMALDWVVVYLGLVASYLVISGNMPEVTDPSQVALQLATFYLPAGIMGVFIVGVLSTAMSTVDSYAVIASTAVVRSVKRRDGVSLSGAGAGSNSELLWIRLGIPLVILLSAVVAARFDRIRDAWVVMASLLFSGLFIPLVVSLGRTLGEKRRRFALVASWAGIVSTLVMFIGFETIGIYDADAATRVLTVGGVQLIREEIIFITIPFAVACGALAIPLSRRVT